MRFLKLFMAVAALIFALRAFDPVAAQAQRGPWGYTPSEVRKREEATLKRIGEFTKLHNIRAPYWPKDGSTPVPLDLMEVVRKLQAENRLRFADLPDSSIGTTVTGEYDPGSDTIAINNVIHDPLDNATKTLGGGRMREPTNLGASAANSVFFGDCMTFLHEIRHAVQHENENQVPHSAMNETDAYRSTLDQANDWINNLRREMERNPNRETARALQGACNAWEDYRVGISELLKRPGAENRPDESVFRPWRENGQELDLDAKNAQIAAIKVEGYNMALVFDFILADPAAVRAYNQSKLTGRDRLLEAFDSIRDPLANPQQFDAFFNRRCQTFIQALGPANIPDPVVYVADKRRNVLPTLQRMWEDWHKRRLAEFDRLLGELRRCPPVLTYKLKPESLTPTTPMVTATVYSTDQLKQIIGQVEQKGKNLFDPPIVVKVTDIWDNPNKTSTKQDGIKQPERIYKFKTTGPHPVSLIRNVQVTGGLPKPFDFTYNKADLKFTIPGRSEHVDGNWIGGMVINSVGGQGCQDFKGKKIELSLQLRETSSDTGHADLEITIPKAGSGKISMIYRLNGQKFTATGKREEGTMTLEGNFERSKNVWLLRGTFSWNGNSNSASGNWDASNSIAK